MNINLGPTNLTGTGSHSHSANQRTPNRAPRLEPSDAMCEDDY